MSVQQQQQQQEQQQQEIIAAPDPPIDHFERHGYLFGYPIAHSYSPLVHNTVFQEVGLPWGFQLLESKDISQFLRLLKDDRLYGSAVTMPHKVAIIPHLDELTDEGRAVGAVNTIFLRRSDSKYIGTNTDTIGVRESFYQNIPHPEQVFVGRPGLVIGGGGAARSAVYALVRFLQCGRVYLVNRDAGEVEAVMAWCQAEGYGDGLVHVRSAAEAERLEGPGAIVACVPNVAPVTEAEQEVRRIAETFLEKPHKGAMLEMCYHPSPWTELGALAETAGWKVILGTEAMIYQALAQHTLWHGRTIDAMAVERVKSVVAEALEVSSQAKL